MIDGRYDFMLFLEAKNCNPNGDPNAGNLPRQFDATGHGYMTDACIKRRVRDYLGSVYGDQPGMGIFVEDGTTLNRKIAEAKERAGGSFDVKKKVLTDEVDKARKAACEMFWDVRAFGAVMSTGPNAGQVRGPVQIEFAESIDPIVPEEISVTRCADVGGGKDLKSLDEYQKAEDDMPDDKKRTIGTKQFIPFGLYRITGHVSANEAEKTGFGMDDLDRLFEALANSFEYLRSASKVGLSLVSPVVVFKHSGDLSKPEDERRRGAYLGCAPAYKLFELVECTRKAGVDVACSYRDYDLTLDWIKKPKCVDVGIVETLGDGIKYLDGPCDLGWLQVV